MGGKEKQLQFKVGGASFPAFQVVRHLSNELQAVLRERQSFLDGALGQLQYQRELSRLQLLHTQVLTSAHAQGHLPA